MRVDATSKNLAGQFPNLRFMALSLWLGWSSVMFSGEFSLAPSLEGHPFDYFSLVQIGSTVVFAAAAWRPETASSLFDHAAPIVSAAAIATLSAICLSFAAIPSAVEAALSALTGANSAFIFLRCVLPFCSLTPKRTTIRFAAALLQSGFYYFLISGIPQPLSLAVFVLTPLAATLICIMEKPRPIQVDSQAVSSLVVRKPFLELFAAILVYAVAMRIFEPRAILAESTGNLTTPIAMLCLIVIAFVLICAAASVKGEFPFARIYRLTVALLLIAVLAPMVLDTIPTPASILFLVIVNFLTMLYRCILAYVTYQSGTHPIRVFGIGMSAIALGSFLGNVLGFSLFSSTLSDMALYPLSLGVAALCIVAAFLIFPESKMRVLLVPVEEPELDAVAKTERQSTWMNTAKAIAVEAKLSKREEEVFLFLARGRTIQQIADKLVLSPYTVKAHIRSIYAKFDIHSRKELGDLIEKRMK